MKWISTKDELPEEGKYVLARHNRGTWHDSTDQDNVNCVVVKLVKGISEKERELMKKGLMDNPEDDCYISCGVMLKGKRSSSYYASDQYANNKVPYNWETFGSDSFFGQDISYWTKIDKLE